MENHKFCFYVPSPLHPAAYQRAEELGVDLIHPDDVRSKTWWEYSDAIIWRQGRVKEDYGRSLKKLKIIARSGTGYDMVNVARCKELGINAEAVAELTYGLAIAVARRTVEFDRRLRLGETIISTDNLGLSLHGRTVGLVGMGDIAREAAKKFHFGSACKVLVFSPTSPTTRWTKDSPNFEETVILHERVSSLEEEGKKQFSSMKKSAIFLNLSRGGLVDEEALYEACKTGQIMGAGIAVYTQPVTAATYSDTLFSLPNVIIQPHIAGSTVEVTRNSTIKAVETAFAYCKGQGIGESTLVKELDWKDLTRRPSAIDDNQIDGNRQTIGNRRAWPKQYGTRPESEASLLHEFVRTLSDNSSSLISRIYDDKPADCAHVNATTEAFVASYYGAWDNDRPVLAQLYRPQSRVVWNGNPISGVQEMVQFVDKMPASKHDIQAYDSHPLPGPANTDVAFTSIVVTVSGTVQFYNASEGQPAPPPPRQPGAQRQRRDANSKEDDVELMPRLFGHSFILSPEISGDGTRSYIVQRYSNTGE
ncbi:MAG: hypothetical protein CYPHOPRED_001964 [Cyphobasidiales sp. Tagirdzhanova-0007]|nr:MAG: hypothetical protein CYPHOPRED_001964 [Cyphobasidiales sp. Tagirdzhanova-0007]